jgi:hypothetical protein
LGRLGGIPLHAVLRGNLTKVGHCDLDLLLSCLDNYQQRWQKLPPSTNTSTAGLSSLV